MNLLFIPLPELLFEFELLFGISLLFEFVFVFESVSVGVVVVVVVEVPLFLLTLSQAFIHTPFDSPGSIRRFLHQPEKLGFLFLPFLKVFHL